MLDAENGQCKAVPTLRRLLFSPQAEGGTRSPGWRCRGVCGWRGTARAPLAPQGAAERTSGDDHARYATWLAASASEWQDAEAVDALGRETTSELMARSTRRPAPSSKSSRRAQTLWTAGKR